MRHHAHRPSTEQRDHDAAPACRVRDRPRDAGRPRSEEMRPAAAALILSLLPAAAAAQELGRLFFTPEQRANLELRRKARMPDKPAASSASAPLSRIDGYVKRSNGPSTIWLNGESLGESAPEAPRIDTARPDSGAVWLNTGEGRG